MRSILVIVFVIAAQFANAETYYVTFVKGTVKLSTQAKNLAVGDKFTEKDQLIFIDKAAKISCISPGKGRFDITADKSSQNAKKEWVAIIKDALMPSFAAKQLSTRAFGDDQTDIEKSLKGSHPNNRILLIENEWISLGSKYHLTEGGFFFIQYDVDGKTTVKKLPSSESAIAFNHSLFVNAKGETIAPENITSVALCMQELKNGSKSSRIVLKFAPSMLSLDDFKSQATVLKNNLQGLKPAQVETELYNHFFSNYGYMDVATFRRLIKS